MKQYGIDKILTDLRASYNIAPTQNVAILRINEPPVVEFCAMRWGLFSAWSPQPIINARSETLEQKPMFKDAFARRRCVLPADGFYEWQKNGSKKQPYFVTRPTEGMMFAGLWSPGEIEACAVVTASAPPAFSHIHNRVPLILTDNEVLEWMNPATSMERLRAILAKATPELVLTPVGAGVGSVKNDSPDLITPVTPAKPRSSTLLFDFE